MTSIELREITMPICSQLRPIRTRANPVPSATRPKLMHFTQAYLDSTAFGPICTSFQAKSIHFTTASSDDNNNPENLVKDDLLFVDFFARATVLFSAALNLQKTSKYKVPVCSFSL